MSNNKTEKRWGFYKKSVITREGDEIPYLIRYNLFECPWFSIKVHRILQSDNDCPHDHPWAFWSIILKGQYFEWTPMSGKLKVTGQYVILHNAEVAKYYPRWSFLRRPAKWVHRLELDGYESRRCPGHWIMTPATTLVITFKKTREWGFWTRSGWVPHEKYHAANKCD